MSEVKAFNSNEMLPNNKTSRTTTRKRKSSATSPGEPEPCLYPIFSSPLISPCTSHKKQRSCKKSNYPASTSPRRKKPNSAIKQGASQNNKILKYLKPKSLLESFKNIESCSVAPSNLQAKSGPIDENKENNELEELDLQVSTTLRSSPLLHGMKDENKCHQRNVCMDVRVSLVRIDDKASRENDFCTKHLSPKKLCCNAAAEYVVCNLEKRILKCKSNPCYRLGTPTVSCISPEGCTHGQVSEIFSGFQESIFRTMAEIDLQIMMIRACCQDLSSKALPSPSLIHAVFRIMKDSADKNVIALGLNFLKKTLHIHPPCTPQLKSHYIHVLNSSDKKVLIPSGLWSLRSMVFFEESLLEVYGLIEGLLSPCQQKDKINISRSRKITKPFRFRESPSPVKKRLQNGEDHAASKAVDSYEHVSGSLSREAMRKKQLTDEAILNMPREEKTDYVFSRFEIIVDILEWDLIVWLARNREYSKIRDRVTCPLVVLCFWKPESDTSFDSVHCRQIFAMYVSSWVLKFHVRHLKTLARLITLIAEVTSASEPNFGNVYPFVGEGCENLARKLFDAMKDSKLGESRSKAIAMIKPDWLRMLVSAYLLGVAPSISAVDLKILVGHKGGVGLHLWAVFLEAVMKFYHIKDTMHFVKHASKGVVEEDMLPHHKSRCHINYGGLLTEIMAYHKLYCQLENWEIINSLPTHLLYLM